jgi:hypothetical protein
MRIYTGSNDPVDFCRRCYPTEVTALREFGGGEGPDGRGNCFALDAEHPPYDGEYCCARCGKELGEDDN